MSGWLTRTKQWIGSTLQLPDDLLLDLPRVTWIGSFLLHIENHKGLVKVEKKCISVRVYDGMIEINGDLLHIQSMVADELVIKGDIAQVEYIQQQGGEKK
ncbi:sporulation protein YqfC [Jeotgalibacillus proteolyticus]|uniref:Sporulation protein YqfC n=1 Tax=Jeotgalibacillus proteolyticus TaxID=2082395 RepID=A0A2S5GF02_9BACL|nr:sporulation protein YqfC [Jeotgalibacillus proteolyticus]PPA71453.1 sporulation protein YqfC [Jeotgalibacillus proteolyticus]